MGSGASVGVTFTGTNANTVSDLQGPFDNFSASGGAGTNFAINGTSGNSQHVLY
jgi:hypothetical protein